MTATSRLSLPFIVPGQAQKEMVLNEAMQQLDLAVQSAAAELPADTPPGTPTLGACYIVGATPTGAWADHPLAIAGWTEAGWRFVDPFEGLAVWLSGQGQTARFVGGGWKIGIINAAEVRVDGQQVLSTRSAPISAPEGGAVADAEGRIAIGAILGVLRHHGLIGA